jgi:hypothetical protein
VVKSPEGIEHDVGVFLGNEVDTGKCGGRLKRDVVEHAGEDWTVVDA